MEMIKHSDNRAAACMFPCTLLSVCIDSWSSPETAVCGNIRRFTVAALVLDQGLEVVKTLVALVGRTVDQLNDELQSRAASDGSGLVRTACDRLHSLQNAVGRVRELAERLRTQSAPTHNVASDSTGDGETSTSSLSSSFLWKDGALVEALERGDWIVLDAANVCSARCALFT